MDSTSNISQTVLSSASAASQCQQQQSDPQQQQQQQQMRRPVVRVVPNDDLAVSMMSRSSAGKRLPIARRTRSQAVAEKQLKQQQQHAQHETSVNAQHYTRETLIERFVRELDSLDRDMHFEFCVIVANDTDKYMQTTKKT